MLKVNLIFIQVKYTVALKYLTVEVLLRAAHTLEAEKSTELEIVENSSMETFEIRSYHSNV